MSYDARLEEKIDATARRCKSSAKKEMFGGIRWLLQGSMAFGHHR